ncbi:GIY-YIG nuclease family protein, partial [Halomonas sp. 707B3]|uniref:GIY-YIG nuclease family protein n=1 Tax=Halomonas sp. 707B3 TaxID=1681043 RepID=UPI00209FD278
ATIEVGQWFIVDGQTAYVAEEGEEFDSPQGKKDARLRVIFSNCTESNLLRLSLVRALYKDEASRRITEPDAGPLFAEQQPTENRFSETWEDDDIESGTIYVLRSLSEHPFVAEHQELIHKIGVTGGKVDARIANAAHDATYLLADVEVVATYKLAGINRRKLEALFHRIFAPAQLELTIQDRFGHPVKPREWFLVPLHVIDEAVQRIRDGSIMGVVYEPETAQLIS